MPAKEYVVFYYMYGHVYQMAEAETLGAREVEGVEVNLYQVPKLVPPDAL
jgi:NAD(P)H dehydrogenase (quinone)